MSDTLIVIFVPGQTGIFSRFVSLAPAAFRQTHFFKALRIFIETPHCTQVLIGLGQPLPLTVMPSSSSLYAFTSVLIKTRQMLAGSDGLKTALFYTDCSRQLNGSSQFCTINMQEELGPLL